MDEIAARIFAVCESAKLFDFFGNLFAGAWRVVDIALVVGEHDIPVGLGSEFAELRVVERTVGYLRVDCAD